ncbi:hypothetical protein RZ960_000536 [Acinetobacter baumannii]|nr:hypothetical protein [Acinetobacter baumannii]
MNLLNKLFSKKKEPTVFSSDQQLVCRVGSNATATAVTSFQTTLPPNYKAVTYESPFREGALNVMFVKIEDTKES